MKNISLRTYPKKKFKYPPHFHAIRFILQQPDAEHARTAIPNIVASIVTFLYIQAALPNTIHIKLKNSNDYLNYKTGIH